MTFRFLLFLALLVVTFVSPHESAYAQAKAQTQGDNEFQSEEIPFSILVTDWNGDMDMIEQLLRNTELSDDASVAVRKTLSQVKAEANQRRNRADAQVKELTAQLTALGPAPDPEDKTSEPRPVASQRGKLNDQLSRARSDLALAELAITRATALDGQIGEAQRDQLLDHLTRQGPMPIAADSLTSIPAVLANLATTLTDVSRTWWEKLPERRRSGGGILQAVAFLLSSFVLAWWLRRRIVRYIDNRATDPQPPYSKRLIFAIAEGIAKGILPASVLGVFILRTHAESSILHSDFGTLLRLGAESLVIFVLVTALPQAALCPNDPAWRLTRLVPENGRRILALIGPLAILFCIDLFIRRVSGAGMPLQGVLTAEFQSVWTFGFCLAQGALALSLLRPSLWVSIQTTDSSSAAPEEPEEDSDDSASKSIPHPFRWGLLSILVLLTVIGMIAPVFGYTNLGNYLINNILGTAILVAILFLLRGLFREAIWLVTASTLLRDKLLLSHKTRNRLKLTARLLLDLTILLVGMFMIAPVWGVSEPELMRLLRAIFGGLSIGSVTIAPTDIALAIIVFIVSLALIRALKTNLAEKILPETEIEESLRHTITAGIGYVGFVVAVGLAIAVAGVDLTNIALIAGALSVGIGFGLQNIVNNFVSGLILLIERPIKVGDWVVVGPNEGFVKQINMRATEIETWQKASVIVPNSDLLSSALKNWTHKDKIGRVDIQISVALDSDIDHVCNVLLEIARAHPRFRALPEPVVLVMNIGESRIDLELRLFTSDILWVMWISSDIKKEALRRFPKEGIKIPYPQHVLHMAEGGTRTPLPQDAAEDPS